MKSRAIEKDEWRFVGTVIVFVLVITSLPYLYAYISTPPDKHFMGIMLDVPDHVQYFSWMRELTTANVIPNKLTPEANDPIFFNLLWWLLARVSKPLGLGFAGALQIMRFTATVVFLILAYRLCARLFADRQMRRTAFLVATFTSGFGWVLVLLKYTVAKGELLFPLDLFVAEGNTILGILGYPHFIAAAAYIFVFDLILQGEEKGQLRYAVAAGLFALFLGWQHTYDLISVYGALGAYAGLRLLRDRKFPTYLFWTGLIVGLVSAWPALYSVFITSANPLWQEYLAQFSNAGVYTPNLLHLPVLLGAAFLLAVFTTIKDNPFKLQGVSNDELFINAWFLITFVLVYLPVDYQIHLLNGWQIPIAILATKGLFQYVVPWVERIGQQRGKTWTRANIQRGASIVLLLAILPTNVYLLLWRFTELSRHTYPYYYHTDEMEAFSWLEDNANPDDVVLSSLTTGQYIPAWAGTHAFLAHWAATLDYFNKTDMVTAFFTPETTPAARQEILQTYGVDYVLIGPAERALGEIAVDEMPFIQPVFTSPLVDIYEVSGGGE